MGPQFEDKQPAGYSLHCYDKDLKEVFASFLPSHQNALMFERSLENPSQFTVAETTKIRTVEIKEERELKIVKMMKAQEPIV